MGKAARSPRRDSSGETVVGQRRTPGREAVVVEREADPTVRGQLKGSLPLGFSSPNRTSAIAEPASVPGYQAMRIAGILSARSPSSSGRPPIMTSTTGFPVAASASRISACLPFSVRRVREAASPESSCGSPKTATTRSDSLRASMAAEAGRCSRHMRSQPAAYRTSIPATTGAFADAL